MEHGEPAAADSLPAPLATPKIQYRTQTLWQQAFWCKQAWKSGDSKRKFRLICEVAVWLLTLMSRWSPMLMISLNTLAHSKLLLRIPIKRLKLSDG